MVRSGHERAPGAIPYSETVRNSPRVRITPVLRTYDYYFITAALTPVPKRCREILSPLDRQRQGNALTALTAKNGGHDKKIPDF